MSRKDGPRKHADAISRRIGYLANRIDKARYDGRGDAWRGLSYDIQELAALRFYVVLPEELEAAREEIWMLRHGQTAAVPE